MKTRTPVVAGLACALLAGAIAIPCRAFVPEADRVEAAIAATNTAGVRTDALRLELSASFADRPAAATAEIVTHPTGLARLELRGARGLVERHLLLGSEYSASRNGEPLAEPRAFLPPLFVLQAGNAATLRAALQSFGVLVDVIGLAPCGDADCYVIGDPDKEAPRPPPPVEGLEAAPEPGPPAAPAPARPESPARTGLRARLWVDLESYEVRRTDSAAGVQVRFGPVTSFEKLRFPAWIEIEEPGRAKLRYDVRGASRVAAPASAFSRAWLLAPVVPDPSAQESAEEPAP